MFGLQESLVLVDSLEETLNGSTSHKLVSKKPLPIKARILKDTTSTGVFVWLNRCRDSDYDFFLSFASPWRGARWATGKNHNPNPGTSTLRIILPMRSRHRKVNYIYWKKDGEILVNLKNHFLVH